MRAVFYTHTAYLEPALGLVRALSSKIELHVVLEVSPRAWQLAAFDVGPLRLPSAIVPADAILSEAFPPAARAWWKDAASFNLVVHNARRFYAPGSLRLSRSALKFIRRLAPDVLHFDSAPLRLGLLAPLWPRVPIVLSEHDAIPHAGEGDWRVDLARWLGYRRVDRFILHNAATRAAFARRYRVPDKRISVARLGAYDLMRAWASTVADRPDPRTVLFFGRLSRYKGLEVLFAAAERVSNDVDGVRWIVAGRRVGGYQLPSPPRLARGGQLEMVEEHVSNQRLVELCRRATVVVCPYVDASQSGVVLTALALGTPVVASAVGGLVEYIEHDQTGLLVPPRHSEALARALTSVLRDAALRHRLHDTICRRLDSTLAWTQAAGAVLDVYQAAVASSR